MIRSSIFAGVVLSLVTLAGCDNAADDQAKANQAQSEANAKIAQVKADAEAKAKAAQADADKKIAEAQADFMKKREDYRHSLTTNLTDLDKKIADLEAKAKTATGKAKTDLDASLTSIRASRSRFQTDFTALDSATAMTWDQAKKNLDKEWDDLKALVDKA